MFALLIKYQNVVTDEEIEIIKQNKPIDHMYVCQEILIILAIACYRLLAHNTLWPRNPYIYRFLRKPYSIVPSQK